MHCTKGFKGAVVLLFYQLTSMCMVAM